MSIGAAIGIGSSLLGSRSQKKAASRASDAQVQAAQLSVDEQKRQFDKVQELLAPYVEAGNQGIAGQLALAGLSGEQAQQQAIERIRGGSEYQTAIQEGENALLQNAAATGGVRGGNTQAALAQFRPQVLNSLVNQQYGRLGGLAGVGQASAAGVGAAAQNFANQAGSAYGQIGAAQAGNALAAGQAQNQLIGNIGNIAGQAFGSGGFGESGVFNGLFGGGRGLGGFV